MVHVRCSPVASSCVQNIEWPPLSIARTRIMICWICVEFFYSILLLLSPSKLFESRSILTFVHLCHHCFSQLSFDNFSSADCSIYWLIISRLSFASFSLWLWLTSISIYLNSSTFSFYYIFYAYTGKFSSTLVLKGIIFLIEINIC